MQQKPQNRPDGSLRRGDQCSGPRDAMAMVAPHRDPRCDNQTAAALIRRPVSHARGGVFSFFCAESTGTSAFAALPVAACSDQLGAGTFFWIAARPPALNKPGGAVNRSNEQGLAGACHALHHLVPQWTGAPACVRRSIFFARHVTIAGRSAGGIVSGFESCGARLSRGASSAASEQAGHAELVRAGCESPALHQWEWPVGPLAGSAPKGEAGTFFGSVADRERHRAVNAAALPSGGSIPPRPTTFARRVAGHHLAGVGVVVADDAQGIGRMAGAGFRGGHGIHSHTAQATRRAEGESRASVSGNEGLSCLRHLTRARPVRRIPNSPFSLPLALDAAASGRGARIFFQVNA